MSDIPSLIQHFKDNLAKHSFHMNNWYMRRYLPPYKKMWWTVMEGKSTVIPFPPGDLSIEMVPWLEANVGKRFVDWDFDVYQMPSEDEHRLANYGMKVTVRRGKGKLIPMIQLRWG